LRLWFRWRHRYRSKMTICYVLMRGDDFLQVTWG
jgi:hypothetical protein